MLFDPRYDAEKFLTDHVEPGDVIEVYGSNVYLPRFPSKARVERIARTPVALRNPFPNVTEVQAELSAIGARKPRFVVVGMGYAWRFFQDSSAYHGGRALPESQRLSLADDDATRHFRSLFGGTSGYANVHLSQYRGSRLFPARPLHASLACDVVVFERR